MISKKDKKNIAIIGAGGQCRAVLAILELNGYQKPNYIFDYGKWRKGEEIMDIPVLPLQTDENIIFHAQETSFILAIGDNRERKNFYLKLVKFGCDILTIISEKATICSGAKIGNGVVISPNVFVGPQSIIGNNVILNTGSIIEHESNVGDHSHLAPGSVLCGRSSIGEGGFLGAGGVIIDKVSVAANSIIGAGSVVIRSIHEEGFTWVGSPVKRVYK